MDMTLTEASGRHADAMAKAQAIEDAFLSPLVQQAWALANMPMPDPPTRAECRLCAELGRACIAHKTPNDFAIPRNPA